MPKHNFIDLTGKQFTFLTVLGISHKIPSGETIWHCKCVCGVTKGIRGGNLRSGSTKSCGCKTRILERLSHKPINPFTELWDSSKCNDRKKGIHYELTKAQYGELASRHCYYCGKIRGKYNGVDRVDNTRGYTLENCVPCCWPCNRAKATMSVQEFLDLIKDIYINTIEQALEVI